MAISELGHLDDSDLNLISRARMGDNEAFATLHDRHVGAARTLARSMSRSRADADDLVSEAFTRVLSALRAGRGPDLAFRPYLLTTLRRVAYDRTTREKREAPTDDDVVIDITSRTAHAAGGEDPIIAGLDRTLAVEAFASLPERWRMVLWHTEVEGQRPAEVATLLGLQPNAVAALAYRAREGLRQAFLSQHAAPAGADRECRRTTERLGAYVRGGLGPAQTKQVEEHLDRCVPCRASYLQLAEVNNDLRAVVGLLVLGGAASAYLGRSGVSGVVLGRHPRPAKVQAGLVASAAAVVALAVAGGAYAAGHTGEKDQQSVRVVDTSASGHKGQLGVDGKTKVEGTSTDGSDGPLGSSYDPFVPGSSPDGTVPGYDGTGSTGIDDEGPYYDSPSGGTSDPGSYGSDTYGSDSYPGSSGGGGYDPYDGSGSTSGSGSGSGGSGRETPTTAGSFGPTTITPSAPPTTPGSVPPKPAAQPDLEVGGQPVGALISGRPGVVAVTAANRGRGAAKQVQLDIQLGGATLRPTGAVLDGWTCTPASSTTLRCTIAALGPGVERTVFVPVTTAAGPGTTQVSATVVSATPDAARGDQHVTVPVTREDKGMSARFATIDHGDIATVGNTLLSCPTATSGCVAARTGAGPGSLNNDGWVMTPVDTDGDAATTVSSSSNLNLPAGAQVLSAQLYWGADTAAGTGGSAPANPAAVGTAKLRYGAGPAATVSADRVDTDGTRYQAVADVTGQVAANPNGTWTISDVQVATGQNRSAGWSLVVAYRQPTLPERSILVFDGLVDVDDQVAPSTSFRIGGYRVPAGGTTARIGVRAYEGDLGLTGDQLEVDGKDVVNTANPVGNTFNSTITDATGANVRNPADVNTFGFDLDRFLVTSTDPAALAPGSTGATITATTSGDRYLVGGVTAVVDR